MSSWIRSDVVFGDRVMIIGIPLRRSLEVRDALADSTIRDNPHVLESLLRELIVYERPDLKGLVMYAMSYDMRRQRFIVQAIHEKFPFVKPGDVIAEIML